MSKKRLALNKEGNLTYCSVPEGVDARGTRCNHISHINSGESIDDFLERSNNILNNLIIRKENKIELSEENKCDANIAGIQEKFIKNNNYIKVDSKNKNEGLSEEINSLLLSFSNLDFVKYETKAIFIDKKDTSMNCCVSESFLKENERFETFRNVIGFDGMLEYQLTNDINEQFDIIVDRVKDRTNMDCTEYLIKTLSLDIITLNPDRHLNNLGVIKNENTLEYKLAPCFDNGLSLMANFSLYPLDDDDEYNMYKVPMSTFYEREPEYYINLVQDKIRRKSDILCIDYDNFVDALNKYENKLYDKKYVDRVKRILLNRLEDLEDEVWIRKT